MKESHHFVELLLLAGGLRRRYVLPRVGGVVHRRLDVVAVMNPKHPRRQELVPGAFVGKGFGLRVASQFHRDSHVLKSGMRQGSETEVRADWWLVESSWRGDARSFGAARFMVRFGGHLQPSLWGEHSDQRAGSRLVGDNYLERPVIEESVYGLVAELVLAVRPMNRESHVLKPAMQWATRGWVRVYPLSAMRIGGSA
ncbi:Uncharacterised protein [Mycobacteroides abscessus subsp. bolletii]|nr:Uncharacterised protein [Mycobacteroides abscessus subsp. bolletii]SHY72757.1 Uncharacterised protein [Mycobacteroides abscessus subsp. bolletii]